jgi:transposase
MRMTTAQREELESVLTVGYDGSVSARAQLVLWASEGLGVAEVAARAATSRPTVYKWLDRYEEGGLAALDDRKSTGRPRSINESTRARIIALTKASPPEHTGLTHWSSYEMSKFLKRHEGISVSHTFVAALWRQNGLKPHRQGTFKLSTDPDFTAKVLDVVGLYLDPPAGAVVLSFDEKTQVQALERTQPLLPIAFGRTEKRTADYRRHGTTNLFAAFNVQTGKITTRCFNRKRASEFLTFMNQVVKEHPKGKEIHVVLDNLSAHKTADVKEWLTRHPNVSFHHTPTGSSWLNQIEIWFNIITKQSIRRGSFPSLAALIRHIENYVTTWNKNAAPFTWRATADEIIAKVAVLDRDWKKLLANNTQ